mmetsp:Transcript_22919/g.34752  ORF Transcript_22919/g.34752 Transcript_22919/m.34752 type:complete len:104 (-) Transcript_22919:893-1204(-)
MILRVVTPENKARQKQQYDVSPVFQNQKSVLFFFFLAYKSLVPRQVSWHYNENVLLKKNILNKKAIGLLDDDCTAAWYWRSFLVAFKTNLSHIVAFTTRSVVS